MKSDPLGSPHTAWWLVNYISVNPVISKLLEEVIRLELTIQLYRNCALSYHILLRTAFAYISGVLLLPGGFLCWLFWAVVFSRGRYLKFLLELKANYNNLYAGLFRCGEHFETPRPCDEAILFCDPLWFILQTYIGVTVF